MRALNGWDVRDNKTKLAPGSKWYLRHSKNFHVEIVAVEGNLVRFKHLERQHNGRKTQKRPELVNAYGFLQVYKPVV